MTDTLELDASNSPDYGKILLMLEKLTKVCQDEQNRETIDKEIFCNLEVILRRLLHESVSRDEIFIEAYRFLRNSVAACPRNQELIREETKLVHVTNSFVQSCCCKPDGNDKEIEISEKRLLAIRCSLQFLSNFMADNSQNTLLISSLLPLKLGDLMNLLCGDEKVIQYGSMIVHLGLKQSAGNFLESPKIVEALLNNLHLEFVIYSVESLVSLEDFAQVYENLDSKYRIKVLAFLNSRADLLNSLNKELKSTLLTNFTERSDFILKSKLGDRDDLFSWEISVLLELLCTLSAEEKSLQSDPALLITSVCLLKQIHEVGKSTENDNAFSPVEDLAKLTSKSTAEKGDHNDIRAHPTFQFKAHLIRLIGNLCHRNRSNQDKVRDLECLPIILDNCKIDARNPFIEQWSILAIRHLCEGNAENQTFIREVQRVDTENLLPKLDLVNIS